MFPGVHFIATVSSTVFLLLVPSRLWKLRRETPKIVPNYGGYVQIDTYRRAGFDVAARDRKIAVKAVRACHWHLGRHHWPYCKTREWKEYCARIAVDLPTLGNLGIKPNGYNPTGSTSPLSSTPPKRPKACGIRRNTEYSSTTPAPSGQPISLP
ncbi:hypothetical protein GE09DRAFT_472571 [Coniochaeta sp. 2T2.1]|nr:hypothetical protein GE09DRAFT_472571 [Coniochaeta sp. 2T2.1]